MTISRAKLDAKLEGLIAAYILARVKRNAAAELAAVTSALDAIYAENENMGEALTRQNEINAKLMRERDTAIAENTCDVCAGTGTPTSGAPCMCAGTGKMSGAAMQLRIDCFALRSEVSALQARVDAAETLLRAWADPLPPNGELYQQHVEKARAHFTALSQEPKL